MPDCTADKLMMVGRLREASGSGSALQGVPGGVAAALLSVRKRETTTAILSNGDPNATAGKSRAMRYFQAHGRERGCESASPVRLKLPSSYVQRMDESATQSETEISASIGISPVPFDVKSIAPSPCSHCSKEFHFAIRGRR